MSRAIIGAVLAGLLAAAPLDLDCGRPIGARELLGRIKLSEIEWAEDVNREAMWAAFGRCAALPDAPACRETVEERFAAEWARQKAAIETKYRQIQEDFEIRCRVSIG
ncbi:MAG TPA: hypothetical protein VMS64_02535 [Candidatus Methylomirabilis sp.]|nr:hypothetical protein [Candidatus Methylomirabilis sp.]